MQTLNIAGYKFISLSDLSMLRERFLLEASSLDIKGTILLSHEGINISLAGNYTSIQTFIIFLKNDERFTDISFHQTYSISQPFKHLRIKLKKEIITLYQPTVDPTKSRAPSITSEVLKKWLDEKRDVTLFDTRNDYEVRFGTFTNALALPISDFSELPSSLDSIPSDKPIVMFCTGGIRCEKAALYMLQQGYKNVYQLDGGILGYFANEGGAHYTGECFVFDERVSVNNALGITGTKQCVTCQGPIQATQSNCANCSNIHKVIS